MKKTGFILSVLMKIAVFFGATILGCSDEFTYRGKNLHVLSGAGLIEPMSEFKSSFEKKHRVRIIVHYGGSGELMGQLATGQPCDIFIPGAGKYVDDAKKKGWIEDGTVRDLVKHVPVIVVAAENPKQIKSLTDLARPGISVALGDVDGCAIGRVSESILKKNDLYDKVYPNIKVRTPTVNQLLLYTTLSKIDASIIWEDMAFGSKSKNKLTVVPIPEEQNIVKTISIAQATRSDNGEMAKMLIDFIDSYEGYRIWSKWGFRK